MQQVNETNIVHSPIRQSIFHAHIKIKHALDTYRLTDVDQLIKQEIAPYVASGNNELILVILNEVEPFFIQDKHELLGAFYCIKGHVYYFAEQFHDAKELYRKSISYAVKYNQFGTVSAAMTNLLACEKGRMTNEGLIAISESIILMQMANGNIKNPAVKRRMLLLTDMYLLNKNYAQAKKVMHYIEQHYELEILTREWLQLSIMKCEYLLANKKYDELLIIIQHILEQKEILELYLDLSQTLYQLLDRISDEIHVSLLHDKALLHYVNDFIYVKETFSNQSVQNHQKMWANEVDYAQFLNDGGQMLQEKPMMYVLLINGKASKQLTNQLQHVVNQWNEKMANFQSKYTWSLTNQIYISCALEYEQESIFMRLLEGFILEHQTDDVHINYFSTNDKLFTTMEQGIRYLKARYYYHLK